MTVWLETTPEVAYQVERSLFYASCRVHALLAVEKGHAVAELAQTLNDAGVIALICGSSDTKVQERTREKVGHENFLRIEASMVKDRPEEAADRILRIIEEQG